MRVVTRWLRLTGRHTRGCRQWSRSGSLRRPSHRRSRRWGGPARASSGHRLPVPKTSSAQVGVATRFRRRPDELVALRRSARCDLHDRGDQRHGETGKQWRRDTPEAVHSGEPSVGVRRPDSPNGIGALGITISWLSAHFAHDGCGADRCLLKKGNRTALPERAWVAPGPPVRFQTRHRWLICEYFSWVASRLAGSQAHDRMDALPVSPPDRLDGPLSPRVTSAVPRHPPVAANWRRTSFACTAGLPTALGRAADCGWVNPGPGGSAGTEGRRTCPADECSGTSSRPAHPRPGVPGPAACQAAGQDTTSLGPLIDL